ncbi:50S ribosome-binding GTPase domain-containing protein [Ditylenchus destructor]|uniref:50S ribosome-binding GTPase domain-containing protein n=1 Tax=Ditylenchus destructor TaxID=166010 RepID=A0AAD4MRZ6_9BILA|nr:50S ribosome-binding GTPase domain-containing protein [Ditylenchus destructor]
MENEISSQNIPTVDDTGPGSLIIPNETRDPDFSVPISQTGILYNNMLKALENRDELTIATMGMTGNGKSTLINSLPGYFAHSSFNVAYNSNELIQPIKYSTHVGQSDTIFSKTYIFRSPNGKKLRLIDMPGFGDTGGEQMDRIHSDTILNALANVGHIDVVLFVFKSDDTTSTKEFRYVMEKQVENYSKDFVKHFAFCFTFGNSRSFDIKKAKRAVQSVFDEWRSDDIHIQLTDENCFLVDNMPFGTLMKRSQLADHFTNEKCWEHSVAAWCRLLLYASTLGPIKTTNIRSISDANKRIDLRC